MTPTDQRRLLEEDRLELERILEEWRAFKRKIFRPAIALLEAISNAREADCG